MAVSQQIININEYQLLTSEQEFTTAIKAVAARTEREGHPGVLLYRFFVDGAAGTASACIIYADADAWLAHHEMAYGWEEMPAFQKNVRLSRISFYGPLNEDMQAWIDKAGIPCDLVRVRSYAAGFER